MKKVLFLLVLCFVLVSSGTINSIAFAQNDEWLEEVKLEILPKSDADLWKFNQEIISKSSDHVRDTYTELWSWMKVDDQIASGIMTWDTIINYGVYILRFLSQAGLAIWGLMIVYVWYQYLLSVLWWSPADWSLISNAVIGILVIVFSYAIMRILTRMFLT